MMGHLGTALLLAAAATVVASRFRLTRPARLAVVIAAGALAFVPIGGLMLAGYLRAAMGDLSIVTSALLCISLVGYVAGKRYLPDNQTRILMATAVLAGVILYPAALGLTYFDPYALGYASPVFVGVVLALGIAAWYLRLEWLVALLVVAALARLANGLESRNLWDYLIDPWLVLFALLWLAYRGLRLKRGAPKAHLMA